ncbi:hypothetical protein PUN28_009942 [Cardiocondyla obscurior]|uniref:Uncharacterized protein n=1 Tax=Cardiocondyla obscurior TaxID=286306 RepID=A0AAW2FRY1_9HYME
MLRAKYSEKRRYCPLHIYIFICICMYVFKMRFLYWVFFIFNLYLFSIYFFIDLFFFDTNSCTLTNIDANDIQMLERCNLTFIMTHDVI